MSPYGAPASPGGPPVYRYLPAREPWPLPSFRFLEAVASAQGIVVRPRFSARTWVIEAVVWVLGFAVAGCMIVLGEGAVRAIGCVLLVPIGIRALVRTIRLFLTKSLRGLKIVLNGPQPFLGGPFVTAAFAAVARLGLARNRGDLYFCAYDGYGKITYLTDIEPGHEGDYQALIEWLGHSIGRRLDGRA